MNQFARTELLIGKDNMNKLGASHVAIFGLGGVGGYALEALARSGIGRLTLVDDDKVAATNLNRQILATMDTLGQPKVDVARARVLSINPDCEVMVYREFFTPDTADKFDFSSYDYIVDAIDTVTGKIELAVRAQAAHTAIISCMGAGNKIDPTALEVTDIYKTKICPLARVMRKELRRRGVDHLKVVYSTEKPYCEVDKNSVEGFGDDAQPKRPGTPKEIVPGSNAFVPAVAGLIMAGEVVRDLIGLERGRQSSPQK